MPKLLSGKLFDAVGQPLYVSGTTKGPRRYRYYVSRGLITGKRAGSEGGWRLSAPVIERAVIAATARMLEDRSGLAAWLHDEARFSTHQLALALKAIDIFHAALGAGDAHIMTIAALIARVDLGVNELRLTLNLGALLKAQLGSEDRTSLLIQRCVPMQLRRRGVEQRIIFAGESAPTTKLDVTLIRAIARGRRWFNQLATRRAKDTFEIARDDGVPDSYVRRLIPLAFLAPSLIEAICSGRQPPELTAEHLTRRLSLPSCWTEQEKVLGPSLARF